MLQEVAERETATNWATQQTAAPRAAFFVPGRIEVLGKHTDYAGGRSLLCAMERGIVVAAVPRDDMLVRFHAAIDRTSYCAGTDGPHWARYADAVERRVRANFPESCRGADIAFAGDLPIDSGMSSSSALVIAIFLALDAIRGISSSSAYRAAIHSTTDLAAYLATIENGQSFRSLDGDRGVGVFGGSEDHTAILCCREGTLSQFAFTPVRHERDIPFGDDLAFVVAYSGVAAPKGAAAREQYNELSTTAAEILRRWNARAAAHDTAHDATPATSLADAVASEPSAAAGIRALVRNDARLAERFEQFVMESETLVPRAADALAQSDYSAFGRLVDESQHAAETMLRNQVPETIALARLAREHGALAASAFGAGFGGSVWALVRESDGHAFLDRWAASYLEAFPDAALRADFFVTRPGPSAHRIA
jgi:galactokinase